MLRPLIPSVAQTPIPPSASARTCAYCGTPTSCWSHDDACVHCNLVLHLDRPRIDAEAVIGWIPELSQAALNRIMRELHCQLHKSQTGFSARPGPHYVSRALSERVGAASKILGTSCASELGQALSLLTPAGYADRYRLLAGVRILPAGQFFVDDEDIYPDILEHWCNDGVSTGVT